MAAVGDDCYFYCTSTCAKAAACPFRHVEAAKTNKIICQHWQTTGCFRPMCKFRHSDFPLQVNYSEIPCYWETQPVGCNKPNCAYKHIKPRPNAVTETPQGNPSSPKAEANVKNDAVKEGTSSPNNFVMPTVKPIIIDPESEASNSSPVKQPPVKINSESKKDDDKNKEGKQADKRKSTELKKNDDAESTAVKRKKVLKEKGAVKKKNGVLVQKNNSKSTVVSKVKKGKTEILSKRTPKLPVKRKKEEIRKEKLPVPVKMKVKDRLGVKPGMVSNNRKDESSEDDSSDSDDSIENVKVLSMEEIFRQKALESMMKKRAAEGKPLLPQVYTKPKPRSAAVSRPSKTADVVKPKKLAVKKAPTPPPESESEEEEGEEEEDSEEEEDKEESEVETKSEEKGSDSEDNEEEEDDYESAQQEDEEEDGTSSSESDSSSSESEDEKVRRVVINLDAEKTARNRAKASLIKSSVKPAPKPLKRKVVRDDTQQSLSLSKSAAGTRVSAKDRLGKPTIVSKSKEYASRRLSPLARLGDDDDDGSDQASDDADSLPDQQLKSLAEIKRPTLHKSSSMKAMSPIKDRLGLSKRGEEEEEGEEEKNGRQILITDDDDAASRKKKAKKRAWSAGTKSKETTVRVVDAGVEEDERTVSAATPTTVSPPCLDDDNNGDGSPPSKSLADEPESPFEALRRRALLKKSQQLQENLFATTKEDDEESEPDAEIEEEGKSGKRKKHKHKHKHKHHKKSKKERQIYVPPAAKMLADILQDKKVPSSVASSLNRVARHVDNEIPDYEEVQNSSKPAAVEAPARRKPKAAAMWAAGLSVSSKGVVGRPRPQTGIATEINDVVMPSRPSLNTSKTFSSLQTSKDSSSAVPVVKTFSQIMAEKRMKRQAQEKIGGEESLSLDSVDSRFNSSPSSSPSKTSIKSDDLRSRVPITPITFDRDESKEKQHPVRVKLASSSIARKDDLFSSSLSNSSPSSKSVTKSSPAASSKAPVSISDVRPSYKTARAKKLFKKSSQQRQEEISDIVSEDSSSQNAESWLQSSPSVSLSTPVLDIAVPSGDSTRGSKALKSPEIVKPRRTSTAAEFYSLDDEFSILDGEDMDGFDIAGKDVEPIDDLLQDIDELLA